MALALTPAVVSESGGVATVTATLSGAVGEAATVVVRAAAGAHAQEGDFVLSGAATLTFAASATVSTGRVTVAAVDDATDGPDKVVRVSGSVTGTAVRAPVAVALRIRDDEGGAGGGAGAHAVGGGGVGGWGDGAGAAVASVERGDDGADDGGGGGVHGGGGRDDGGGGGAHGERLGHGADCGGGQRGGRGGTGTWRCRRRRRTARGWGR